MTMGKLLLAFAIGVALTTMTFVLFDAVPRTQNVELPLLEPSMPGLAPIRDVPPPSETTV
jgi:hypothetical protein